MILQRIKKLISVEPKIKGLKQFISNDKEPKITFEQRYHTIMLKLVKFQVKTFLASTVIRNQPYTEASLTQRIKDYYALAEDINKDIDNYVNERSKQFS